MEVLLVVCTSASREYEGAALPLGPDEKSAQQALIDVISKCRPADAAKPALRPYLEWVENHPVRGKSLLARQPAFFAWLKGDPGKKPKE